MPDRPARSRTRRVLPPGLVSVQPARLPAEDSPPAAAEASWPFPGASFGSAPGTGETGRRGGGKGGRRPKPALKSRSGAREAPLTGLRETLPRYTAGDHSSRIPLLSVSLLAARADKPPAASDAQQCRQPATPAVRNGHCKYLASLTLRSLMAFLPCLLNAQSRDNSFLFSHRGVMNLN